MLSVEVINWCVAGVTLLLLLFRDWAKNPTV